MPGKSKSAIALYREFREMVVRSYVLDSDNICHGLDKNLEFNPDDRKYNIRMIGEVAKIFVNARLIVTTAFIYSYRENRNNVRRLFE